jgi:heat shock protein HslJ
MSLASTGKAGLRMQNGMPILPETSISARFDDEGTVSGSAGCNRYRAAYEVDGSGLTVGAAVTTMMACLPPLMEQERAYKAALAATVSYELSGDTL